MALTKIKADALTADLIDETKLADNSIDSEHYNDGSIDNVHLADNAVGTDEIADDAVTADKLADSINTAISANTAKVTNATHTGDVTGATALTIATGAVEHAMLAADAVDGDNIADDSINSEHYVDGSIDNAHLADDAVGADELAADAVVNASVASGAAIAGSKISPDFGAQAVVTTSSITGGTLVGTHGRAPTNTQGGTYTLVLGDAGKVVKAAGNVTLDQNVFADGDIVWIYNSSGGDITLIQGTSVTLRLGGDAGTGTRTIAQKGICTVLNVAANEAVAGGVGVS